VERKDWLPGGGIVKDDEIFHWQREMRMWKECRIWYTSVCVWCRSWTKQLFTLADFYLLARHLLSTYRVPGTELDFKHSAWIRQHLPSL
jgi:hypothetical protein